MRGVANTLLSSEIGLSTILGVTPVVVTEEDWVITVEVVTVNAEAGVTVAAPVEIVVDGTVPGRLSQ